MKSRLGLLWKITFYVLLFFFLLFTLTGCWNRRELDELAIIIGIGLDKAGEPGKVQVTAQIFKPGELQPTPEGGGGGNKAHLNITDTGESVNSAVWGLTHKSSRRLYFPHNQVIIFSREIAEEGVQKYLDFFLRNHEGRLTVSLLVALEKASEILEANTQFEKIPVLDIADLLETQIETSSSMTVNLEEFLTKLMSKTTSPVAPFINVAGEGTAKKAHVAGMAVFKKDKLVGQLDETETRGLLWVIGEVKRGIIDVPCPGGEGKASLEIIRASSKITPEKKEGRIQIKVSIKEEGTLGGQSCPENLALLPKIIALEQAKATAIQREVMAAIIKAQELNTDIFGFGEAVRRKFRQEWPELESRWDEIFPNIQVEVIVDAKLRRIGRITATNPEKE